MILIDRDSRNDGVHKFSALPPIRFDEMKKRRAEEQRNDPWLRAQSMITYESIIYGSASAFASASMGRKEAGEGAADEFSMNL